MHLFLHLLLHQHPQGMLLLLVHAQLLSQHYHRSYIPAVDVKQFPDTKNFVSFHCCTIIATPRAYTEILVARTLYSCKQCTTLQGCLATLQGRIQRWFDTIRPNPPFSKYLKYFLPARIPWQPLGWSADRLFLLRSSQQLYSMHFALYKSTVAMENNFLLTLCCWLGNNFLAACMAAEAEPAASLGSSVLGLNQLSTGTQGGHLVALNQL